MLATIGCSELLHNDTTPLDCCSVGGSSILSNGTCEPLQCPGNEVGVARNDNGFLLMMLYSFT